MDTDELLRRIKSYNSGQPEWVDTKTMVAEIERLRAGQFRWIAVTERMPTVADGYGTIGFVLTVLEGGSVGMTSWENIHRANYTHWAPIPPLPERTQEEKDEALWKKHVNSPDCCSDPYGLPNYRLTFLAGLKAARGEK